MARGTVSAPLKPRDRARKDLTTARENAASANSVPALRAEVVRLADALEAVLEATDNE